MANRDEETRVTAHYGREHLAHALLEGLRASGKDLASLTTLDLAPGDQFHTRGRDATLELARLAGLAAGTRVLDVGGGIGGPARTLASEFGCQVTVLDLTEAFCQAGQELTERVRLGDRVTFRHGSALDMPFAPASFDTVWTQHSSMNIDDKERLYGEIRRVLRPGARLAIHEIMAGPAGVEDLHFPVPWASLPAISFLRPAEGVRALVRSLGFEEQVWVDTTAASLTWFRERVAAARAAAAPPPVGLHLLLGAEAGRMLENVTRNLEEDRLAIIQAVWTRERSPQPWT